MTSPYLKVQTQRKGEFEIGGWPMADGGVAPPINRSRATSRYAMPRYTSSNSKPSIDLKGLVQLITSGAGSPFLGDYKGIDEETGNFMFELEANNLTDENGESKQTKAPYFESGWVDEDAEPFRFPWQKKK